MADTKLGQIYVFKVLQGQVFTVTRFARNPVTNITAWECSMAVISVACSDAPHKAQHPRQNDSAHLMPFRRSEK